MSDPDPRAFKLSRDATSATSEKEQLEARLVMLKRDKTARTLDLMQLDATIVAYETRLAELHGNDDQE